MELCRGGCWMKRNATSDEKERMLRAQIEAWEFECRTL